MTDIRPIEEMIENRLKTRGLVAPRNYYDSSINIDEERMDEYNPRKMLYSARAEAARSSVQPSVSSLFIMVVV